MFSNRRTRLYAGTRARRFQDLRRQLAALRKVSVLRGRVLVIGRPHLPTPCGGIYTANRRHLVFACIVHSKRRRRYNAAATSIFFRGLPRMLRRSRKIRRRMKPIDDNETRNRSAPKGGWHSTSSGEKEENMSESVIKFCSRPLPVHGAFLQLHMPRRRGR